MNISSRKQSKLVLLTAVLTFTGGVLIARGQTALFGLIMGVLILAWLVTSAGNTGERPER